MLAHGPIFQTALARIAELQRRALLDEGAVLRAAVPALAPVDLFKRNASRAVKDASRGKISITCKYK